MRTNELPAPTSAPVAAVLPLWIWRSAGSTGAWLPHQILEQSHVDCSVVEPFAAAGMHHALAQKWRSEMPREADEKLVRAAFQDAMAVVHTVDGIVDSLHAAMIDAATPRAGRHVVLYVRDSARRLVDRLTSAPTRPSIGSLIKHDREATTKLGRVLLTLRAVGVPVHALPVDDLATEDQAGDKAWLGLCTFMRDTSLGESNSRVAWRQRLQNDFAAMDVALDADLRERVRREANWAASAELAPSGLKPALRVTGSGMNLVRLDRLPPVLLEGETIRLSGVVVPEGAPATDRRLVLRQGRRRQSLVWNQSSPAIAAKLPGQPAATQARFKTVGIRVSRREPVSVLYRAGEDFPPQPVADIAFEPIAREPVDGIFVAPWSIGYQPIPKVACTSIKEALFRLATGEPYSAALSEGASHVHSYFDARMRDVGSASFRFIVVRDPIKRFLSAFSNRVLHHRELSRPYLERLKLDPPLNLSDFPFEPKLAEFVENFEFYRRVPTIEHHFRPFSEFTAPLAAFDKVYPFEAINELMDDLQQRTGVSMSLPHSQRGGPKLQGKDLSPRVFDKLVNILAADYAMLEGLYSPAALR